MGVDGHTHDAAALEVEGGVNTLSIQAIELSDGVAGGGIEAAGEHGRPPSVEKSKASIPGGNSDRETAT